MEGLIAILVLGAIVAILIREREKVLTWLRHDKNPKRDIEKRKLELKRQIEDCSSELSELDNLPEEENK